MYRYLYLLSDDPIRLVNGTGEGSGRVEIYHEGEWGTVCDDAFEPIDATVICRSLGLGYDYGAPATNSFYGEGEGRIWMDNVRCNGDEGHLGQCRHRGWGENDCRHSEDASVYCCKTHINTYVHTGINIINKHV